MFELTHFIWLGIAICIIVGMLLFTKYKKLSFNTVLTIIFIISILSEVIKILNNMNEGYKNGRFLDPGSLPFHLCSIQIFFIVAIKLFKIKESTKEKLLGFMFPTMLLGGVLALLIPTCGTEFNKVQVYQYFIFHSFIIFFGIYIIRYKLVTVNFKVFERNICYLLIMALCVTWINSFLSFDNVNFMYLCRPPMDNLPILNLDHGWYVYFAHLLTISIIAMFLIHLPFIIKNDFKKKGKSEI